MTSREVTMLIIRPCSFQYSHTRPVLILALALPGMLRPQDLTAADVSGNESTDYGQLLPHVEPLSPDEALSSFEVDEGLEVQLAAAEPEVADPISIAWDADGRMFVGEMRGYPYDPPPGGGVPGRVRMLEDKDGDGYYETATVFAENVHWPSGIACWKDGIFVAAPPDILYLKDVDSDGKADFRQIVFTGFGTRKSEDIMNNLKWGLDHLIYGGSSYNGGEARRPSEPEGTGIGVRGQDFRFNPANLRIQAIGGTGDFGNCFDDWGNRFTCSSGTPFIHEVIPAQYVARNPYLSVRRLVHGILESDGRMYSISAPEPWRSVRLKFWDKWVNTSHDMRAGRFPEQELAEKGYITGASGIEVFRGNALLPEYQGNAFVGEPAGNLVIRTELEERGPTFVARRVSTKKEFLASRDNWFRPVNLANGPDGCLYVLDMYREVIEDPSAIPQDILDHLDYYTGMDMGRIYRIAPKGFEPAAPPKLNALPTVELVALLEHPNAWHRETAHRLIYERRERTCTDALRQRARTSSMPQARLHALWSLQGLDALDDETLRIALSDAHAAIREHAIRLVEPQLYMSPAFRRQIQALADDDSPRVRFQVALTLSVVHQEPAATDALARIALRDPEIDWMRVAVLTASAGRADQLILRLLDDADFMRTEDVSDWLTELAAIVGGQNEPASMSRLVNVALDTTRIAEESHRRALIIGLGEGIVRGGGSLRALINLEGVNRAKVQATLDEWFAVARETALDYHVNTRERGKAVDLLAHARDFESSKALAEIIHVNEPDDLQLKAVRALSQHSSDRAGELLVARWKSCSPNIRNELAEVLFSRIARLSQFLDGVELGMIPLAQLDSLRREMLLRHPNLGIRSQAEKMFRKLESSPRAEAIQRYRPALELDADAGRGFEVFQANCATCHRVGDTGIAVGPDLAGVASRTPEELLENILDPNRQVQANYVNYMITTFDGRIRTGIIAEETPTTVSLRRAEGAEDIIMRDDVNDMTSMGLSIMPEELETGITPQQMADLITFIRKIPEGAAP